MLVLPCDLAEYGHCWRRMADFVTKKEERFATGQSLSSNAICG
jgi:hypothetical protein